MPLMYSQPKYGLNSSSGLGCRGVLEMLGVKDLILFELAALILNPQLLLLFNFK